MGKDISISFIIISFLLLSCKNISPPNKAKAEFRDQSISTPFELNIQYVKDYSTYLFEGTYIYHISEKEIKVVSHYNIVGANDVVRFSNEIINDSLIHYFSCLPAHLLDDSYNNENVMQFSGTSMYLTYRSKEKQKKMYIHCYTHPALEVFISKVNQLVPKDYEIKSWHSGT